MSGYVLNVRCKHCHALYCSGRHGADFYNHFNSRICGNCGCHGFFDSVERWVSRSVWWKPWTWCAGYWEEIE